ncbi:MAG: radical SAM protein [Thermoanaerobaculia bacterium]
MSKSLYLINPRSRIPTYFGAEVFEHWGFQPAQANADLATVTVAALAPQDWQICICDEHVEPVDFDTDADFVGITGKVTQENRMIELADEFRRRGKTVILGGPYASLSPEVLRGHCDILVIGELESMAEELFSDLDRSRWQEEYRGDRPDLSLSPVPRWDLYKNDRALLGSVQTSRGCPFECEFCDVIQYLGRKQRHKPIQQVLAELDVLYEIGYRAVFLADDNLTVYRRRAKELLAALRDWNTSREDGPVGFGTQLSIDAARDPEIMRLLAESGMTWVFIGIETPNEESLRETKKRQNVGIDLIGQVQIFFDHGISVIGGMIVGFDHDGLDIFERQLEFAMRSPIPIFTLGALVAPASTPLYERMERDGRLRETGSEYAGTPWDTNLLPCQMSSEELVEGLRWLCNQLYRPENFAQRMLQMIESLGPQLGPFRPERGLASARNSRTVEKEAVSLLRKFIRRGPEERKMWADVFKAMAKKPGSEAAVMLSIFRYAQVRCLYDVGHFWEPRPAEASPFQVRAASSNTASTGGERLVSLGS